MSNVCCTCSKWFVRARGRAEPIQKRLMTAAAAASTAAIAADAVVPANNAANDDEEELLPPKIVEMLELPEKISKVIFLLSFPLYVGFCFSFSQFQPKIFLSLFSLCFSHSFFLFFFFQFSLCRMSINGGEFLNIQGFYDFEACSHEHTFNYGFVRDYVQILKN